VPSILFVAASGNSDEDVAEAEIAPQSFRLPNLIKVGAVDPAGNAAGFTTFGSSVDVYTEGFQIAPLLGGQMSEFVGTSAAAPAIVNLAAKLLAVRPSLSPPEVIDLIKRGGSRNEEGLLVANPKRSMQILNESGAVALRN
jgi:subtilisin family serine protease